ncbi:MAG: UvrD-helicase domain-containing protein [Patescibacteria group bacterium]|jgi:DNA helicase-2/ATP-dependent DNA helicase PcrA
MNDLLDNLNPPQREAVLTTEGPVLVLAGAGSGKTKALTHRIAYLIKEKHVSTYNLLAVTFTNKAAGEMASRVSDLLTGQSYGGEIVRLPWLGTFHSICVRILRRESNHIGYDRGFTIYDDGDQLSIIKRIMKDLNIDPKHYAPQAIRSFISGAKNEFINAQEYKKYNNSPFEVVTSKVYERYEKYLREVNAMDFDDLLVNCVRLFDENPQVLERYQDQFKYILVDEYQDTNHVQYLWVKMLAAKHGNIMVVGDDSQSIYGWRGANFRNILNFEKHYPSAQVIKLEQNYRSTQVILEAANEVIRYNRQRTDKKLWTKNQRGLPISIYEALNEKDESEFIALEIASLARTKGQDEEKKYSDFAVLYRTNAQSRAVEEAFLRFNIPYRVVGGMRFYERKEIKDIVAYLRVIANPRDFEAFERVVATPSRGIGEKTLTQIRQIPNFQLSVTNQTPNLEFSIPGKIVDFLGILDEMREYAKDSGLPQLIEHIAVKSGYRQHLLDGTPEGEGRWENVMELMTVAESVQKSRESDDTDSHLSDLERFIERVMLAQDVDEYDKDNNVVTLMTLHSAKGLEFRVVFIVGVEEGLFPHTRALADESEMEEERRLCYVGITRARERLYLLYASERVIYGRFQSNPKSRFIECLPDNLIDKV